MNKNLKNYIINNLTSLISSNKTKEDIKEFLDSTDPTLYDMIVKAYSNEKETEDVKKCHSWCSRLNIEVSKKCNLDYCEYHVNWLPSNNCILGYLNNFEKESLNFNEISYLLNIKYKEVLKIYNNALSKVQKNPEMFLALSKNKEEKKYYKKFEFVQTNTVCCVCESRIPKGKSYLQIPKIGLAYCSQECKDEKPINDIIIEYKQGIESKDYINLIDKVYNKSTKKKILAYIKRKNTDG